MEHVKRIETILLTQCKATLISKNYNSFFHNVYYHINYSPKHIITTEQSVKIKTLNTLFTIYLN